MTKTALLVIDVQRIYMEPDPMVTRDGDDLIEKCSGLIEEARSHGVPVLFVRHLGDDSPEDEVSTDIHPALGRRDGEPVITKRFGSAFFRTDLKTRIEELGATRLVLCGLATFGCVNATVLCAVCKGYDVVVAEDAHGNPDSGPDKAAEVIDYFNRSWQRAGATLVRAADARF